MRRDVRLMAAELGKFMLMRPRGRPGAATVDGGGGGGGERCRGPEPGTPSPGPRPTPGSLAVALAPAGRLIPGRAFMASGRAGPGAVAWWARLRSAAS